jgi:hypothetical protein
VKGAIENIDAVLVVRIAVIGAVGSKDLVCSLEGIKELRYAIKTPSAKLHAHDLNPRFCFVTGT